MKWILLLGLAVAVGGCATPEEKVADANIQISANNAKTAQAQADKAEADAVVAVAGKLDAGGASAYLVAKALKGLGIGQQQQVIQQAPQSIWGTAWTALLQLTDVGLRAYGIKVGGDVARNNSDNNRITSLGAYSAFTQMGGSIASAGTAGYPYVQAPGATTNTTTTLSGTGVLGSGTYNGPITTNRNCPGGTAGNSGGTAGGPGGPATGGTC